MSSSRRNFFQDAAVFTAGLFGLGTPLDATTQTASAPPHDQNSSHHHASATISKSTPPHAHSHVPVTTPDVPDLPFTLDASTKVFRLRAEPVKPKIPPFKTIDACAYTASSPCTTIHSTQA